MPQPLKQAGAVGIATALAFAGLAYAGGVGGTSGGGPASAQQYKPKKITICHHAQGKKGTKHVTIRISERAWPAHRRHGDTLGACSTAKNEKVHKGKAHAKKFHKQAKKAKKGKKP